MVDTPEEADRLVGPCDDLDRPEAPALRRSQNLYLTDRAA
jgi:hypothetical protein